MSVDGNPLSGPPPAGMEALRSENAELRRMLGGGCGAAAGGYHVVIRQGRYAFCANCGESLRGVRFCHEPPRMEESRQ